MMRVDALHQLTRMMEKGSIEQISIAAQLALLITRSSNLKGTVLGSPYFPSLVRLLRIDASLSQRGKLHLSVITYRHFACLNTALAIT